MIFVAHRGASGYAPENTLAAFSLALEMGAESIELDVRQSRDGRLVVIHDRDLGKAARPGERVADLTWRQLGSVDVGTWFSPRFSSERIPLLEDVLKLVDGKAVLYIEIKEGGKVYPGIEENLLDLLEKRKKGLGGVIVSSFDHATLFKLRGLSSGLKIGYLVGMTVMARAMKEAVEMKSEVIGQSWRRASPNWVRESHKRGMKFFTYTLNSPGEVQKAEEMRVDGIFTDFPDAVWEPKGGVGGTD